MKHCPVCLRTKPTVDVSGYTSKCSHVVETFVLPQIHDSVSSEFGEETSVDFEAAIQQREY